MYTVYILYSASIDRYYVGSTGDLADRLHRLAVVASIPE